MTLVRPQDLSFMAGGAVAAREGVFVRRTSPTEDVAEVFTRSTVAPRFDENGVVRSAAVDTPRLNWRDFDRDGVYEQAVLPIHPRSINVVEFNVPGGTPADFELGPVGVTNQTDEFYVQVDAGDTLRTAAPANWDPNEFLMEIWGKPKWDNDDGELHDVVSFYVNGSNYIWIWKSSDGTTYARVRVGGVTTVVSLLIPFSAGDEFFVGLRLNAGTATIYADTNGDLSLNSDSAGGGAIAAYADLSWTLRVGQGIATGTEFGGGLNLAILNIGSSADPITDRFAAGDGEDIKDWLAEVHPDSGLPLSEHLVIYAPKSKDGEEVKTLNFEGETYLSMPGPNGAYASVPDAASLDVVGDLELQWYGALNDWTPAAVEFLVAKDEGAARSFYLRVNTDGKFLFFWNDGASRSATSTAATGLGDGAYKWIKATLDVDDGGGNRLIKFWTSDDGLSWGQLGATVTQAGVTSISSTSALVTIGGDGAGTNTLAGKTRRTIIKDGIDGTVVLDADFTNRYTGIGSFIDASAYAHTVTIHGAAKVLLDPASTSQLLDNTGFETDANNWTGDGANISQSAAQADEGSESLLVDPTGNDGGAYPDAVSLLIGRWYANRARLYPVTSSAFLENKGTPFGTQSSEASSLAAWNTAAFTAEAIASESASPLQVASGAGDDDDFYLDEVFLHLLAEPAFSTATKGTALPMIDGLGGAWGVADASSVTASGEGIDLPFDTDYGTTIVKLESGPAGSGTRRYMIGLPGSMNGFSADALAGMVVGVYVPSSSEITPAQVTTHAVDDVGENAGDVAGLRDTWEWLWVARTFDVAATEAYFELRFADGVSLSGSDEVMYMAVPTAVAGGVPLVPVPQITEGTTTVEEEDFYAAFEVPPGATGIYVKARLWAPGKVLFIGQSGGGGASLRLQYNDDGTCVATFDNGPTSRTSTTVGTVDPGEEVQLLGNMTDTGQVQLTMKVGSEAEEQASQSGANIMVDDWGDQRAYLGSKGGIEHGTIEVLYAKIVRGSTYTLEEVGAVT